MSARAVAEVVLAAVEAHGFGDDIVERVNAALGEGRKCTSRRDVALAVAQAIINELMDLVGTTALHDATDPLDRIAGGIRGSLLVMVRCPSAAGFLGRIGYPAFRPGIFGFSIVERDVVRAMDMDLIPRYRLRTAMDLIVGPVFSAMATIPASAPSASEIDELAYRVLLAVGAAEEQARHFSTHAIATPLPAADSLLERSTALDRIAL